MYCTGSGSYEYSVYYGIREQKRERDSEARINTCCCYEHEFLSFKRIDTTVSTWLWVGM